MIKTQNLIYLIKTKQNKIKQTIDLPCWPLGPIGPGGPLLECPGGPGGPLSPDTNISRSSSCNTNQNVYKITSMHQKAILGE